MDHVSKDIGLFQEIAGRVGVPLAINPKMVETFKDGEQRYGSQEFSPNIILRPQDATGLHIRAPRFAAEIVDDEPEVRGAEVKVNRG